MRILLTLFVCVLIISCNSYNNNERVKFLKDSLTTDSLLKVQHLKALKDSISRADSIRKVDSIKKEAVLKEKRAKESQRPFHFVYNDDYEKYFKKESFDQNKPDFYLKSTKELPIVVLATFSLGMLKIWHYDPELKRSIGKVYNNYDNNISYYDDMKEIIMNIPKKEYARDVTFKAFKKEYAKDGAYGPRLLYNDILLILEDKRPEYAKILRDYIWDNY